MQTDAADAPNSQENPQHWISKSQINKKKIKSKFKYIFQENPSKKRERKTQYRHKKDKIHNTGKYEREG